MAEIETQFEDSPADPSEVDKIKTRRAKRVKFDYKFLETASRLMATGIDQKELAFIMGVHPVTISTWKDKYPRFREAIGKGRELAVTHMTAAGIRSAIGYNTQEVHTKYEWRVDDKTQERVMVEVERKVVDKELPPNAALIQFFLTNLAPDIFKKRVEIDQKSTSIHLTGKDVAAGIKEIAGKLMDGPMPVLKSGEDDAE